MTATSYPPDEDATELPTGRLGALQPRVLEQQPTPSPSKQLPESTTLQNQSQRQRRTRSWYAHMVLLHLSEFGAEAARGLVLPTLFTYVQDLGGDIVDMGLLTALFSVGRFFSSLLFGWLCDRTSFRVLYNVAGVCAVVGNLLYVLPYSPAVRSKALLALSRFIVGFGAGNRSVCRANIAMLTRVDQRLQYFTIFATVVFLAYALTPGLGGVVGDTQVNIGGQYFQFNRFTAPGFLLVLLNVVIIGYNNLIFDASISRDDAPGEPHKPLEPQSDASDANTSETDMESKPLASQSSSEPPILSDRLVTAGMLIFIFLNFNARGILSIFETVNVPLFLEITNRTTTSDQQSFSATQDAASFYLLVGLLGLVSYSAVQLLRKKVSDVGFLLVGFTMLLVGNAVLLTLCTDLDQRQDSGSSNSLSHEQHFDVFVVAEIFVWSIGCPLTSAVVVSAFSKVLGTRPQGLLMGVFGSSASIARMVLPFLPGALASWALLFLVNMVLCAVCILVLVLYLRLLSHSHPHSSNSSSLNATVAYSSVQLHSNGRESPAARL